VSVSAFTHGYTRVQAMAEGRTGVLIFNQVSVCAYMCKHLFLKVYECICVPHAGEGIQSGIFVENE